MLWIRACASKMILKIDIFLEWFKDYTKVDRLFVFSLIKLFQDANTARQRNIAEKLCEKCTKFNNVVTTIYLLKNKSIKEINYLYVYLCFWHQFFFKNILVNFFFDSFTRFLRYLWKKIHLFQRKKMKII